MKQNHIKGSLLDWENRQHADISTKKFVFKLLKKNLNPSVQDSFGFPKIWVGLYIMPNISFITEDGKERTIRYIPGEPSIYKDQQSDDRYNPKKPYKVDFVNGRKVVPGSEILLLEFMMKCNLNASNKNRKTTVNGKMLAPSFELEDNSIAVSKEIAKDKLVSEVTGWCWTTPWDEAMSYARVLNVNLLQTNDEVRHDLKVIAMRDPEKFLRDLKNPSMKKKHYVLEAVDRGYLTIDTQGNYIAWQNNPNQPLAVAPVGISPVDVLVQKLSTDDGKLLFNVLLEMLTPEPVVTSKLIIPSQEEMKQMKHEHIVAQEPLPPVRQVEESDSELMDIVEDGLALGLITKSGPFWLKFKGENLKGKDGAVNSLRDTPMMLKNLKWEIQKAKAVAAQQV